MQLLKERFWKQSYFASKPKSPKLPVRSAGNFGLLGFNSGLLSLSDSKPGLWDEATTSRDSG